MLLQLPRGAFNTMSHSLSLCLICSSTDGKRIESFVECEGLDTFGRFSFNGCNKEIEVYTKVILLLF